MAQTTQELLQGEVQLRSIIGGFFADIKNKLAGFDSLSIPDTWNIFNTALSQIVLTIETYLKDLIGPEKKALALAYLERFFDEVLVPIDIPWVPAWLEKILDPLIKKLFLQLASGAIDALVSTLNKTGVFK